MLRYRNPIPVAAHRGQFALFSGKYNVAFRSALELKPDMIETVCI